MNIALAQLNYTIGDFTGNVERIISAIQHAESKNADLVVFSELAVCGYPPHDLLEHKVFIDNCNFALNTIAAKCTNIAAIVGAPTLNKSSKGKNLFNSAVFIEGGEVRKVFQKALLPTYDIFDEYRYFQPNFDFEPLEFKGKKIALTICEDLWYKQPILTSFGKEKLYTVNPMEKLAALGCDFAINIAASPFAYNHEIVKSGILSYNAQKYKLPLIYLNQVGAHTDLIFDGASRVLDAQGNTIRRLKSFDEDFMIFNTDKFTVEDESLNPIAPRIQNIHDAIILGIRDYFSKMGFTKATLGLSGGIDSAVTLVLAEKALGAKNLHVLLMPSQFSSDHSIKDAEDLANHLGVKYTRIPINHIFSQYLTDLTPLYNNLPVGLAEENIQARIRGTLLMALSNKFGNLLLNTSNKSEVAVGYGTLYGDMNGGISVLGDVYKTDVYEMARFINSDKIIIPANSINKPPSAELRPDQKDSDSLPDYALLDPILFNYIELRKPEDEIIADGFDPEMVKKVIRLVNSNEYKRFQTPPILRVSSKAFGSGRKMPLVAKY